MTLAHIVAWGRLNMNMSFYQYMDPMSIIRLCRGRLFFNMVILYVERPSLYWDGALVTSYADKGFGLNASWPQFILIRKCRYYINGIWQYNMFSNNKLFQSNKTHLRDLIDADGLVILLKLDSNLRFYGPYDLEIWLMTSENNMATIPCYVRLCVSFRAIGEFKLDLHSWNAQSGSQLSIFCPVRHWNLTDEIEKWYDTSSTAHEPLCVIS